MTTVYGYQVRDDITAGRAYTVTMPPGMSSKRFRDAVELVKGIGERPGSSAEFSATAGPPSWTVTVAADGKNAAEDLQLAEAKYGVIIELIEEPQVPAATDPADYADRDLDQLAAPSLTEEMRDYRREIAVTSARTALEEIEANADYAWYGPGGEKVVKADNDSQWRACQLGRLEAVVGQLLAVIEAADQGARR
ncbi:MAG TPA: hypothetical protein VNO54_06555 [Streptosporangiaceae bacterium]|nr:hypothetical protein [Streptosporangiaceae bacterium]